MENHLKDFKIRYLVACFSENQTDIAIKFLTPEKKNMSFANTVQGCIGLILVMRFVLFCWTVVTVSRVACSVVSGLQRISSSCRARPERKMTESNFTQFAD